MKSKLPNTTTSIFATMSQLAAQEGALNMSQGFPSFPAAEELKKLHAESIMADQNQYASMMGLPELRQQISIVTQEQHGAFYNPDNEICLTAGATQGIYTIIQSVVHPGDEVIILTPAYDCYAPSIELAGGKVIEVQMNLPDFTPDWQRVKEAITPRTRMIVINSPHNPSGNLLTETDMLELQKLVVENDLLLLSDEVYEHIVFDNDRHLSAARFEGLRDRSFITGSFGKTFHVTGWKMGYCLAPAHLMQEFLKVHQQVVFCVNRPVQHAIFQHLQKPKNYLELGKFYQRKRDLFLNLIADSKFKFTPTQGSYFQLLDYSDVSDLGDLAFAKAMTRDHKLASIPISVFMNGRDPNMLRFCFAKEDHELISAAQILNGL
jgi:methionine aminotransferase